LVTVDRRYISLVLVILVASTAMTYTIWLLRTGDPIELLILEAPESLFASVQVPRTISIAVSSQRDLDSLEFRFRCLLEKHPPKGLENLGPGANGDQLMDVCPAIRGRLEYFRSLGAEDYVVIREVPLTSREGVKVLLVDFAGVLSTVLEENQANQSYTTFAIMLNQTGHPVGYFEGFAELFTAENHLLELVRVESGGKIEEYYSSPGEGQVTIAELGSHYGVVGFESPLKGGVQGVSLFLKKRKTDIPGGIYKTKVAAPSYLTVIETYVEGNYVPGASGYWQIYHGDAPEEG
jgi:hypothetical protein